MFVHRPIYTTQTYIRTIWKSSKLLASRLSNQIPKLNSDEVLLIIAKLVIFSKDRVSLQEIFRNNDTWPNKWHVFLYQSYKITKHWDLLPIVRSWYITIWRHEDEGFYAHSMFPLHCNNLTCNFPERMPEMQTVVISSIFPTAALASASGSKTLFSYF